MALLNIPDEEFGDFEEMCYCAGITTPLNTLTRTCLEEITILEIVFSNISILQPVAVFKNLSKLVVIDGNIESLDGLGSLENLVELWVAECKLTAIGYLKTVTKLKKLYLYSNRITELKGLHRCKQLEVLWLSGNNISVIENLDQLTHLKELNLADNKIKEIGNALRHNIRLEALNLSGNKLSFLKDLIGLDLPRLRSLALADPLYLPNPLCGLCNYTTCVAYHFRSLQRLDGQIITESEVKKETEMVRLKKLYYTMHLELIKKARWEVKKKLQEFHEEIQTRLLKKMQWLDFTIREYERVSLLHSILFNGTMVTNEEGSISVTSQLKSLKVDEVEKIPDKISCLVSMIKQCEDVQKGYQSLYQKAADEVDEETNQVLGMFNMELESIGTVRFQEGKPSDNWYQACQDLLLSRFCANHFADIGIVGVKMKKCTKVVNESLEIIFRNKLQATNKKTEQSSDVPNDKKLNYLFLLLKDCGRMSTALQVIEHGCSILGAREIRKRLDFNRPEIIKLTNSLYHLDMTRLNGQNSREVLVKLEELTCHTGSILLMKVHSAFCIEIPDGNWILDNVDGIDVCYRTLSDTNTTKCENSKSCSCDFKCYEYYAVDPDMVVPAYLLEFEYIFQSTPVSPFLTLLRDGQQPIVRADKLEGETNVEILAPIRAPVQHFKWNDIEKKMCTSSLYSLQEINLNGMQIVDTPVFSPLHQLQKLILSFNCMTNLNGICNLSKLKILDVSHNFLLTLEGLQCVPSLTKLNIGHNQLKRDAKTVAYLSTHTPNLTSLTVKGNPWPLNSTIYHELAEKLMQLTCLDNKLIGDSVEELTKNPKAFNLEFDFLFPRVSTARRLLPTLSLQSSAQIFLNRPGKTIHPYDPVWHLKITSLNLSDLGLDNLNGINKLENLRWACFSHNNLSDFKDTDKCYNLEEIYLDNNNISNLEGISNLKHLITLNLNHNQLTAFTSGDLGKLHNLQNFMVSYNQISNLEGLQYCTNLIQLHLINNKIESIFTLALLRSMIHLSVLMLSGNPVANLQDCKHTIIYNLPNLLGLDGKCISSTDITTAKQILGGRLTTEFIKDHIKNKPLSTLVHLDLSNCSLLSVHLNNGSELPTLRSINLEKNLLTTFSGLVRLNDLKVLCLNCNHVDSLFPRAVKKSKSLDSANRTSGDSISGDVHVMKNLEVLHLAYNDITQLEHLQLHKFPSLKTLFLQGNKIKSLSGLEGLWYLEHLVLDRNHISVIRKGEVEALCWLQELHLQENLIKDLPVLSGPSGLQKLYLGSNRIKDLEELFKLSKLPNLEEVSFVGNSVTRRALHRLILIHFVSTLTVVDGIPVTTEERVKASKYFNDGKYEELSDENNSESKN